jgi:hypothetical protein
VAHAPSDIVLAIKIALKVLFICFSLKCAEAKYRLRRRHERLGSHSLATAKRERFRIVPAGQGERLPGQGGEIAPVVPKQEYPAAKDEAE